MSETESDPESIAKKYLDALNHGIDGKRQTGMEDRLSELQGRREKYVEEHGEDSGIVRRVDQNIGEVRDELEELEQSARQVDEIREELLEAAVEDFEFNSMWLSPPVLKGLTHALYGEKSDRLVIDQSRVESTDDLADVDDLTQLDMEHTLLLLVEDRLGQTDTVRGHWERLADSKTHTPFLVVAREGRASPDDVLSELNGDADRKNAKNWLEGPMYNWEELVPYYRAGDGEFALSTAGRYLAQHYAENATGDGERESGADNCSDGGDDEGQASLTDIDSKSTE